MADVTRGAVGRRGFGVGQDADEGPVASMLRLQEILGSLKPDAPEQVRLPRVEGPPEKSDNEKRRTSARIAVRNPRASWRAIAAASSVIDICNIQLIEISSSTLLDQRFFVRLAR